MPPSFTAIVCTYNRAELLPDCIDALARQDDDDFEVLVIDNNSTDETPELLRRMIGTRPRWTTVREPVPGLCVARNRGMEASTTEVVAFIDDDARPWPGWSRAMREAFTDPEVIAAGGPIILDWDEPRPTWMPRHADTYLTTLDLPVSQDTLRWPEYPFGANMGFRRSVLVEIGGFDPTLSRRGKSLVSGDDSAVFRRLMAGPGRVAYVPSGGVYHRVQRQRCTLRFLLRRSFAQGRTQVLMHLSRGPRSRRQIARSAVGSILVGTPRAWPSTRRLDDPRDTLVATGVLLVLELARSLGNSAELLTTLATGSGAAQDG